jgi:organic radical activating enzyme
MNSITHQKHNFLNKLLQEDNFKKVQDYISDNIENSESHYTKNFAPISINLDLTTSCNYACDHCVDMKILNNGIRFELEQLKKSLLNLIKHGLKSVIIIGGGEPTVSPFFPEIVTLLKKNKIQIGIVSNGSRPEVIRASINLFTNSDWIRYSLDSSSNELFEKMHLPKKKSVNLKWICESVKELTKLNSRVSFGFSFIIVWANCNANDTKIHENIDEMVTATKLARENNFNYISFKPFLDREENNAEVIGGVHNIDITSIVKKKIIENLEACEKYSSEKFKIIRSTNLNVFLKNLSKKYQHQPKKCHVNYFRQVLSPLGTFACPVYRNIKEAQIGDKNAYLLENFKKTAAKMGEVIQSFDASINCKNVVCLYNEANWAIENKIKKKEKLNLTDISKGQFDSFL